MSCLFFCPLLSLICLLRFKYISNLIGNYILINYYGPYCGPSYGPSYVACCGASYGPCYGPYYGPYYGAYVEIIKLVFY